jgi:hypothetical protein
MTPEEKKEFDKWHRLADHRSKRIVELKDVIAELKRENKELRNANSDSNKQ